jgi:hypothetical protein
MTTARMGIGWMVSSGVAYGTMATDGFAPAAGKTDTDVVSKVTL